MRVLQPPQQQPIAIRLITIQSSIDRYPPRDYGAPEARAFLGHQTVRLNGFISKAPNYVDLISDERLLTVIDHFMASHCGECRVQLGKDAA